MFKLLFLAITRFFIIRKKLDTILKYIKLEFLRGIYLSDAIKPKQKIKDSAMRDGKRVGISKVKLKLLRP